MIDQIVSHYTFENIVAGPLLGIAVIAVLGTAATIFCKVELMIAEREIRRKK